jgi:exodeoxyribonuclease VII small subunit
MPKTAKKKGFEAQLLELEEIARKLESGSLPLEESLLLFERGIKLSRELQSALQAASLRVTKLLEGGPAAEAPLDMDAGESEPPDGTAP